MKTKQKRNEWKIQGEISEYLKKHCLYNYQLELDINFEEEYVMGWGTDPGTLEITNPTIKLIFNIGFGHSKFNLYEIKKIVREMSKKLNCEFVKTSKYYAPLGLRNQLTFQLVNPILKGSVKFIKDY